MELPTQEERIPLVSQSVAETSPPEEVDVEKEVRDLILEQSRVGGCFRMKYVLMAMYISAIAFFADTAMFGHWVMPNYLAASAKSNVVSAASSVQNQLTMLRFDLYAVGALISVYHERDNGRSASTTPFEPMPSELDACEFMGGSILGFARYNATDGRRTLFRWCPLMASHPTSHAAMLELPEAIVPRRSDQYEATRMLDVGSFDPSVVLGNFELYEGVNPSSMDPSTWFGVRGANPTEGRSVYSVLIPKQLLGQRLLFASEPKWSSVALLRHTTVGIFVAPCTATTSITCAQGEQSAAVTPSPFALTSDFTPILHSLTPTAATYDVTQPTVIARQLLNIFASRCRFGHENTWFTFNHLRQTDVRNMHNFSSFSNAMSPIPEPDLGIDGDVDAILCGMTCTTSGGDDCDFTGMTTEASPQASCREKPTEACVIGNPQNIAIVVRTTVADQSLETLTDMTLWIAIGGLIITIMVVTMLNLTMHAPIRLLNLRIAAVLTRSGEGAVDNLLFRAHRRHRHSKQHHEWRQKIHIGAQWLIDRTKWSWLSDIISVINVFHVLAAFFVSNQKYVPLHILHQQVHMLCKQQRNVAQDSNSTLVPSSDAADDGDADGWWQHVKQRWRRSAARRWALRWSADDDEDGVALLRRAPSPADALEQLDDSAAFTPAFSSRLSPSPHFDTVMDHSYAEVASSLPPETGPAEPHDAVGSSELSISRRAVVLVVQLLDVEAGFAENFSFAERLQKRVFAAVHAAIRRYGGEVFDRSSGVRIGAAWNAFGIVCRAEDDVRRQCLHALRCAADIATMLRPLRVSNDIRLGITVHSGPVVCGVVGDEVGAAIALFGYTATWATQLALLAASVASFHVLVTEPVKDMVSRVVDCITVDYVAVTDGGDAVPLFDVRNEAIEAARRRRWTKRSGGDLIRGRRYAEQRLHMGLEALRCHSFWDAVSAVEPLLHDDGTEGRGDDDLRPLAMRLAALSMYQMDAPRINHTLTMCGKCPQLCRHPFPNPYARPSPQWEVFEQTCCSTAMSGARGSFAGGVEGRLGAARVSQASFHFATEDLPEWVTNKDGVAPRQVTPSMGRELESGEVLDDARERCGAVGFPTRIIASNGVEYARSDRVLGRGSSAVVYLGMEQHTSRLVAMKCLTAPVADEEAAAAVVSPLMAEVESMEQIHDINLVQYYGYHVSRAPGRRGVLFVIVMECLVAGSVASLLQSFGPLPPSTVIGFARDILRGLHRLHEMGMVHRDVKPQNVLMSGSGHCKLTDFGASAWFHDFHRREPCGDLVVGDEDEAVTVVGTPAYLSPEAAHGAHPLTPKSDIWSLGVMLVEMLTGDLPFRHDVQQWARHQPADMVLGIRSGSIRPQLAPALLAALGKPWHDLFGGCLVDDPGKRLSAAALLQLPIFS